MDKNKNREQQNPNKGGQSGEQNTRNEGRQERRNEPVAQGNNPSGKSGQQSQGEQNRGQQNQGQQGRGQQEQNRGQQSGSGQQSGQQQGSQSGEWKRPVTNQDEQRQPTNAGAGQSPMGEEETEGDREREERLKPYKNVGDDSEEVEKKTPTME